MSEVAVPFVHITLDKPRRLLLTLEAMVKFEEKTGKDILGDGAEIMASPKAKDLQMLLWACLLHDDPELTPEEVGRMIHIGNIGELMTKLEQAWSEALPDASEEDDADPLTGSRSAG